MDLQLELLDNNSSLSNNSDGLPAKQLSFPIRQASKDSTMANSIESSKTLMSDDYNMDDLNLVRTFTQELDSSLQQHWQEIEERIFKFLDENNVEITDPHQKEREYFEEKKKKVFQQLESQMDDFSLNDNIQIENKVRSYSGVLKLSVKNSKFFQKRKYTEQINNI